MQFRHIPRNTIPPGYPIDPAVIVPRLLPGETEQGFLTAAYIPRQARIEELHRQAFSRTSLKHLL
jgi:hypothetical protein